MPRALPTRRLVASLLVTAAPVLVGCARVDPGERAEVALTVPPTTAPPTTASVTTTAPPTTAPSTTPPAPTGPTMPDVVCRGLQDAQDRIQASGVFFSRSRDASGRGRAQLWDRSWTVVGQSPPPGTPIGEGDAVLDVVRTGEVGGRCSRR